MKNIKFTQALVDIIKEAGLTGGCPKAKGNLLYTIGSKVGSHHRATAVNLAPRTCCMMSYDSSTSQLYIDMQL